jgi:gamma-D-glutamyl-L-lysine dipeptidyl-peptidase
MQFGICDLSLIPLRSTPSHQSEQVSQLLFGDVFEIISKQEDWVKIISDYDAYQGWMAANQLLILPDKQYFTLKNEPAIITHNLVSLADKKGNKQPILAGSRLPFYKEGVFTIAGDDYLFTDKVILPHDQVKLKDSIHKLTLSWLNAPYQWGGRSVFGVDCSGFTQIIFKQLGIKLMRDAYQQAESGEMVNFISEGRCGDLAFFDNEDKKIVHTGILLGNDEIIHASGRVRIDKIDHYGIFNSEKNNYSHHLRMIKRYF